MATLVRQRMHILKFVPRQLYGFAVDEEGKQVFFHIRAFVWGEFTTRPPPIVGEPVEVEFDASILPNGKVPRARNVHRVSEPRISFGIVEEFHEKNGYGFIRTSDGRSHYLHRSEMSDERLPMSGMEVTFFEGYRQGRTRACYVTILDGDKR